MSQDKHEQDFEEYLQGETALSSRYQQSSSEQVPEHLDDAILAASRRAVQSKPKPVFSPFSSNWQVPLSLAAVLVLSVTVIVTIQEEHDEAYIAEPAIYQPQSSPVPAADNFSNLNTSSELRQFKDSVEEKEKIPAAEFDSDYGDGINPAKASRVLRREVISTGKSENTSLEEVMVLSAKQSQKVMSELPAPSAAESQAYVTPPGSIAVPSFQDMDVSAKTDDEAGQVDLETKSKRNELAKKRKVKPMEESAGRFNPNERVLSSASDSMIVTSSDSREKDMTQERSPDRWLELIARLWQEGNREEALRQLHLFNDKLPEFNEKELTKRLDLELLKQLKTSQQKN